MDKDLQNELKRLFKTKLNRAMRLYLETCTRCGNCIEACHVYNAMPEIKYSAVGRHEIIRKIFRKYFKLEGKIAPWLGEVIKIDEPSAIDRIYEAAYSCTGCRRCMVYCPFGIDTQMIMSIAKLLLIGAEREPKVLSMLSDMSIAKGTDIENSLPSFKEAVRNIEPEVLKKWDKKPEGRDVIPVHKENADVLYAALSAQHSITPAASIMNAAGENWTLSCFEAVNFGAFLGDPKRMQAIAKRIIDEALKLKVKEVAVVECGTAFRALKYMTGKHPFKVVAFAELIARYLKEGRIRLDPARLKEKLTYHDPCQIARNGGVIEEPRYIISRLTENFVELTPNRIDNWCCGGGGGLIALGEKEFRMKSSKIKAEQVKESGADMVCTSCENCLTQLSELNEHYGLAMKVESLTNLVSNALVM